MSTQDYLFIELSERQMSLVALCSGLILICVYPYNDDISLVVKMTSLMSLLIAMTCQLCLLNKFEITKKAQINKIFNCAGLISSLMAALNICILSSNILIKIYELNIFLFLITLINFACGIYINFMLFRILF